MKEHNFSEICFNRKNINKYLFIIMHIIKNSKATAPGFSMLFKSARSVTHLLDYSSFKTYMFEMQSCMC